MYRGVVWLVQGVLSLAVMVDWTSFDPSGFLVPLNLQYVAIILFHRSVLRWLGVPLTPVQSLWVSVGVALHPLGMVYDLYGQPVFWDHVTHFYSGTLVAAVILVVLWRSDLSHRRVAGYSFVLMLVASGLWELFELLIATTLTVYGFWDTVWDVVFNLLGWLTVLLYGHDRLVNVDPQYRD